MLSLMRSQLKASTEIVLRTGKAGTRGAGTDFRIDCNILVLPGSPLVKSKPAAKLNPTPILDPNLLIFNVYQTTLGIRHRLSQSELRRYASFLSHLTRHSTPLLSNSSHILECLRTIVAYAAFYPISKPLALQSPSVHTQ